MKNKTLFLLSAALLLSGCSQANATVTKSNEPIMTIGSTTYTRGDEYDLLKVASGANMSVELIRQAILDKEVKRTNQIKQDAEQQYNTLLESNPDLETQLKSAGYKDKSEYINKVLIPSIQSNQLIDKYFVDAEKEIKKQYKPSLVKIIQCDDEKTAKKALTAVQDGVDLNKVYEQYSSTASAYKNEDTLISTDTTNLPTRLINTMNKQKKTGPADEIFKVEDGSNSETCFVAILIDNKYENILENVKSALSANSKITNESLVYFLKKYNFEVHDQFIFDYIRANNPEYLYQYPELSQNK